MFVGSLLALTFVHHRGVILSGDEPSYVGEAFALGRLHTWNLGSAFASTEFNQLVGHGGFIEQSIQSHGIQFPYHALGLSVIIAPVLALIHSLGAVHLELLTIMSALVIWLGFEVTKLTGAAQDWLVIPVALFLAPGYLLATTQIYPDLLSGLIIAIVTMRLMNTELRGSNGLRPSIIDGVLITSLVWIDDKNIVVGVLVGVVAALVAHRHGGFNRDVLVFVGLVFFGVATIVSLNIYAYGHPLGALQEITPFSGSAWTKMVELVFDRRHGILVQSPAVLLGIFGAVRWWRRTPWGVTVGVGAVAVILVGNASLATGMAGGSFVGRYEWEALPLALAFGGLALVELAASRRRAAFVVIGTLFALAVFESWALFYSRSDAISFSASGWDPATYFGWWGRLDPSPILNYMNGEWTNARNLWGLGTLVALTLATSLVLGRVFGGGKRLIQYSMMIFLAAFLCWGMTITSPFVLPSPMQYAASDLGPLPLPIPSRSITVNGPDHQGTIISGPLLDVLPGRYRVDIVYRLNDNFPRSAIFELREESNSDKEQADTHRTLPRSISATQKSLVINVTKPGDLSAILTWRGTGRLTVKSVTFNKIATCHVVGCQGGLL